MKHILRLLIVTLLFGCSNNDDTSADPVNTPIEMVSEQNRWFQRGSSEWFNGATGVYETTKKFQWYYFEGDTLINGLTYKKMYSKEVDSLFHQPNNGTSQFISKSEHLRYIAAMRQDALTVYYVYKNATTEDLYADFNINLGDVLNYKWSNGETVTEISEMPIGDTFITKYKLSNAQYFYEGIGGSYGLFKDWSVGVEGGSYLSCFKNQTDMIHVEEGFFTTPLDCPEF